MFLCVYLGRLSIFVVMDSHEFRYLPNIFSRYLQENSDNSFPPSGSMLIHSMDDSLIANTFCAWKIRYFSFTKILASQGH